MLKQRMSISLRLALWFGVIFFFGWVLFGTAMWFNLKRTLTNERRLSLTRRMERLETLLNQDSRHDLADQTQQFTDFAHATGNGLAEVFNPSGLRVFPSPSKAATAFPWPASQGLRSEIFVHVMFAGQPYWVLARHVSVGERGLVLMAAAPENGSVVVLESFWTGLLQSIPVLLLLSSVAGYWISRRALGPVDRITAKARSITIRNLSERLPHFSTGDELQRLAETCNAMLARLEGAVNQIRQFTADASHELRGPLSYMRIVAEVALRDAGTDSGSRQAFEAIVSELGKTTTLLEDMLTLARADAGSAEAQMLPMDLTDVVRATCRLAQPIAEERELFFVATCKPEVGVEVLGDFMSLRRLLWILLDNAIKYTEAPGRIEVELNVCLGKAVLEVRDTGIGIGKDDLPLVFNRFFRADPSRGVTEGTGLGLSIGKWIADLHQADLSILSDERRGTIARVMLPMTTRQRDGGLRCINPGLSGTKALG